MINDIIWDFDGTLFDTYPKMVNDFKTALADYGIDETNENIHSCMKVSESYTVTYFKALYKLNNTFFDKYISYKKNMKLELVQPFPNAMDILQQLVFSGGRNYILTHRGDSTMKYLEYYGMRGYFTEIVTSNYGFMRKPDPEAFLYLIDKYQMNKCKTMVVGDRELEILGGKSVGIKTCLYDTNQVTLTVAPDYYINSLNELIGIINTSSS